MPDQTDTSLPQLDGHLYKLSGKKPVPCSMAEWMQFMTSAKNRIIEQKQIGKYLVSTIFTGMDRSFGQGEKLLFETTVLGLDGDLQPCWRFSNWNQAVKEHRRLVVMIETNGIDALLNEIKAAQQQ